MTEQPPGSTPRQDDPLVARMTRWLTASQADRFPYDVDVLGHAFTVLPDVFSPRYYPETAFYAAHLVDRLGSGRRLLDLGCGIGVNATLGALRGALVTALDVNPAAVDNTVLNARRHGVLDRVDARQSDVFSALSTDDRFDVVYWNVPFAYRALDAVLSPLEEAVFDPGYRKNAEFLAGAGHHLAPGGEILMGVSDALGDVPTILAEARAAGLVATELARTDEPGAPEGTDLRLLRLVPADTQADTRTATDAARPPGQRVS